MDTPDSCLLHKHRYSQSSLRNRCLEPKVMSSVSELALRLFLHCPKIFIWYEAEMSQECQQPTTTSSDLTCRTKPPLLLLPSIWILPGPAFLGEVYLTSCHHCLVTEEHSWGWSWSWISRYHHEEEPLKFRLPVSAGSPAFMNFPWTMCASQIGLLWRIMPVLHLPNSFS